MATEPRCDCGRPATENDHECARCWLARVRTVSMAFSPSRSNGSGQIDPEKSRRWDSHLEDYKKVRAEGSQPANTTRTAIDETKRLSDMLGAPYSARTVDE